MKRQKRNGGEEDGRTSPADSPPRPVPVSVRTRSPDVAVALPWSLAASDFQGSSCPPALHSHGGRPSDDREPSLTEKRMPGKMCRKHMLRPVSRSHM